MSEHRLKIMHLNERIVLHYQHLNEQRIKNMDLGSRFSGGCTSFGQWSGHFNGEVLSPLHHAAYLLLRLYIHENAHEDAGCKIPP